MCGFLQNSVIGCLNSALLLERDRSLKHQTLSFVFLPHYFPLCFLLMACGPKLGLERKSFFFFQIKTIGKGYVWMGSK